MKTSSEKLSSYLAAFPFLPLIEAGFSNKVQNFIFCQSCLETNFGLSRICRDNCNLFGMKHPSKRLTLSKGCRHGHASYFDNMQSVNDYLLYLAYMRLPRYCLTDVDKFANWLRQQNYCPSPTYVDGILAIYNRYFTNL